MLSFLMFTVKMTGVDMTGVMDVPSRQMPRLEKRNVSVSG